jgi:hypothetical protein
MKIVLRFVVLWFITFSFPRVLSYALGKPAGEEEGRAYPGPPGAVGFLAATTSPS